MRMFVALLCLLSLALAEPPVSNGYESARSGHHGHHHRSDHHQSHEHGPGLRNTPSQAYLPTARISQEYGAPGSRGLNEEYAAPAPRGLSQEYGVPDIHSTPSHEYEVPNAKSGSSQQYDIPSQGSSDSYPAARSPSPQYGVPELRSAAAQRSSGSAPFPTQKYGIPRSSSSRHSQFRSNPLSQGYSAPSPKSAGASQGYSAPRNSLKSSSALRSPPQIYGVPRNVPSQTYGTPASRSLLTSYGAPNARNSESYPQGGKSHSYGPPSQENQADTIEIGSARGLSQDHGTSSSGRSANLNTDAITSSYAVARHATHGASGHDMPSEQYGVPQQYSAQVDKGYDYARAGLDEQHQQEEASYDFAYKVDDYESESEFGHQETREDNKVEGSYFVVLPDGTKQTVEYEADERGFRPRISLEHGIVSPRAGYDENAQDLTSSGGPY